MERTIWNIIAKRNFILYTIASTEFTYRGLCVLLLIVLLILEKKWSDRTMGQYFVVFTNNGEYIYIEILK